MLVGGLDLKVQEAMLRKNPDIVIATPGILIGHIKEREGDRVAILAALICRTFHDHTIVFVQTKNQAHRLHILLGLLGVKIGQLHGNLSQPQRMENLIKFKDEEVDVLITTDAAASGLDISGVKTVINFVMPATMQHYIHKVDKTARAGKTGVSV